jgi:thiamine transport system permease protein
MDSGLDCGHPAVRTNFVKKNPFSWLKYLLWLVPLLFLGFFFFYPLGSILSLAIRQAVSQGKEISSGVILRPLWFTLWQAVLSTLLTLLAGLPAAYVFARFSFPGKRILSTLTTLPFILPTVVAAAGINALLGPRGWLNLVLMQLFHLAFPPLNIVNTLAAILIAHVFYNIPIVIRVVGSAWVQLDPRMEQAASVLGATRQQVTRKVTFPLLRPSLMVAALLVFLFDFTSFGVILILGGPRFETLEVAIYTQALSFLNLPAAGLLSLVQITFTLMLTWVYSRLVAGMNIPLLPRLKGEGIRIPRRTAEKAIVWLVVIFLILLQVLPLAALVSRSVIRLEAERGERGVVQTGVTLDYYRELFINRTSSIFFVSPARAALNSLLFAMVTVLISVSFGLMAAYALARLKGAHRLMDLAIMLPLGTSAVTLGLGFIITFNHPPLDARSFPLIIPFAHSLVALPFVVRTVQPVLASIPESYRQAASVLGATPWQVWWKVEAPIIRRSALVGAIFSFTISLGEFGATSFLARPDLPTLPVAIYRYLSQPGALNYGQAMAMSTILLLVCGASIFLLERIQEAAE